MVFPPQAKHKRVNPKFPIDTNVSGSAFATHDQIHTLGSGQSDPGVFLTLWPLSCSFDVSCIKMNVGRGKNEAGIARA